MRYGEHFVFIEQRTNEMNNEMRRIEQGFHDY